MKNYSVLSVFLTVTLLLSTGCATIFTGTTQSVDFSSSPTGAKVDVDGKTCTAPCSIEVAKGESHKAIITKDGRSETVVLGTSFNAISILNMLGLVGWIVDIATGAVYNVSPDMVNADFKK